MALVPAETEGDDDVAMCAGGDTRYGTFWIFGSVSVSFSIINANKICTQHFHNIFYSD